MRINYPKHIKGNFNKMELYVNHHRPSEKYLNYFKCFKILRNKVTNQGDIVAHTQTLRKINKMLLEA